jgi:hypothetical protein
MSVRTLPEALLKRAGQIDELAKINGGKPPVLNTHVELGYPTHHDVHA